MAHAGRVPRRKRRRGAVQRPGRRSDRRSGAPTRRTLPGRRESAGPSRLDPRARRTGARCSPVFPSRLVRPVAAAPAPPRVGVCRRSRPSVVPTLPSRRAAAHPHRHSILSGLSTDTQRLAPPTHDRRRVRTLPSQAAGRAGPIAHAVVLAPRHIRRDRCRGGRPRDAPAPRRPDRGRQSSSGPRRWPTRSRTSTAPGTPSTPWSGRWRAPSWPPLLAGESGSLPELAAGAVGARRRWSAIWSRPARAWPSTPRAGQQHRRQPRRGPRRRRAHHLRGLQPGRGGRHRRRAAGCSAWPRCCSWSAASGGSGAGARSGGPSSAWPRPGRSRLPGRLSRPTSAAPPSALPAPSALPGTCRTGCRRRLIESWHGTDCGDRRRDRAPWRLPPGWPWRATG